MIKRYWKKEKINPRTWESFTNCSNNSRLIICRNTQIYNPDKWKIIISYSQDKKKIYKGYKTKKDAKKVLRYMK